MQALLRASERTILRDTGPVGQRSRISRWPAFIILAVTTLCIISPQAAVARATAAEPRHTPQSNAAADEAIAPAGVEGRGPGPMLQGYGDWPVIASIEDLGENMEKNVPFALQRCTRLRVYGSGAGGRWGMEDLVYVENVDTGQAIWQMYLFETLPLSAGTRQVERPLTLPAGSYQLHFSTQGRTRQPPRGAQVGVTLYQDSEPGSSPPVCWPRVTRPEDLG